MAPLNRPPNYSSFHSWLAVAGAALGLFSTVGFINAFGVFQERYRTLLHSSDFQISWIGSLGLSLMALTSPGVGILIDKYGPRIPLCVGSVVELIAIFMTSLGTKYYQVLLSQGVLLGFSMALVTTPCLAVVSRRVPHHRGAALGLTIGGSSAGGVIWPIMLQQLMYHHNISYAWSMRIAGFVMIAPLSFACLTVKNAPDLSVGPSLTPAQAPTANKHADESARTSGEIDIIAQEKEVKKANFSVLRKPSFLFLCLGLALTYLGLVTPLFYLPAYAIEHGIDAGTAFYLLSGCNAASFFGRVVPGIVADRYGHFNLISAAAVSSTTIAFCWTKATSLGGVAVFGLAYGFASGGVMSLQSSCAGKLAHHGNQGIAVGFAFGSVGITALVGSPIAGQILGASSYLELSMWTAATMALGSISLITARIKAEPRVLAVM